MNQLVLSLSYKVDGKSRKATDSVIDATVSVCTHTYDKIDESRDEGTCDQGRISLVVAGANRVSNNSGKGIDKDDWDSQWTVGENMFGEIIKRIGLERFSPISETGQPQLIANLLDHGKWSGENAPPDTCETAEVATGCLMMLKRKGYGSVNSARIVVPIELNDVKCPTEREARVNEVVGNTREIFESCWREGPLRNARISFDVVEIIS
mmetsp:Transcript_39523/g.58068  ORF Transcript_39523/g.58068 Transcript_39523/m.58068 type:complete len:209 (-) Transcript_39523:268-894(-)|eukprot:CAMPEP_0195524534 /NCGR_PEP_ID=MMETSP0794_2-20130614/24431_1 /TAXON_ID=515487 /ORGANISM="Stephanopyxis turris, Strain CCMP 815" /LENGTH=208 /DNA_ID=CAMNT_0040654777 /DNA_START=102 /DNA_END=728 /DNA_ORIENTATION=-